MLYFTTNSKNNCLIINKLVFVKNVIVCQLVSVELSISKKMSFDGKLNIAISYHLGHALFLYARL